MATEELHLHSLSFSLERVEGLSDTQLSLVQFVPAVDERTGVSASTRTLSS